MIGEIASWLSSPRDAAALSLTGKLFNKEMERRIYNSISLPIIDLDDTHWALLLRTFASRPDLAARVQKLELEIHYCTYTSCPGRCLPSYMPATGFSSIEDDTLVIKYPPGDSTRVSSQELQSLYAGKFCPAAQVLTLANLTPKLKHLSVAIDDSNQRLQSIFFMRSMREPTAECWQRLFRSVRPSLSYLESLSITGIGGLDGGIGVRYKHDFNDLSFFWNMPSLKTLRADGCDPYCRLEMDKFKPQTSSITKLVLHQTSVNLLQLSTLILSCQTLRSFTLCLNTWVMRQPLHRWREIIQVLEPAKDALEYLSLGWSLEDIDGDDTVEMCLLRVLPIKSLKHFSSLAHVRLPFRALFVEEHDEDDEEGPPYSVYPAPLEDILPPSLSILELNVEDSERRTTYEVASESFERLRQCAHDKLPKLTKVAAVGRNACTSEPTDREKDLVTFFKEIGVELDWNSGYGVDWHRFGHDFKIGNSEGILLPDYISSPILISDSDSEEYNW
ncbi:uncharacterized protein BDZ99DRAFT_467249 [Mytilinidion resinicola]|uniref:Uncharacterized protein n=1 Tax=Mytilinidion resinicola TaxID=574789 RepID=A0A6A6Y7P3_9PEZI|nr:uncharacterized protein BDZ99DRAFT_467249 [Mytilinidion resinicola]KAF2804553.1 hypothetical protein BDZ99DRAFT_467249 [Mytilinidion resinicola]